MPVIALFVLSLLWGSTFYFTKMVLPDFHPVSIVFYRCLLGGLTLLPFFLWKRKKQDFKNVLPLIGITLLSTGIPLKPISTLNISFLRSGIFKIKKLKITPQIGPVALRTALIVVSSPF